MREVKGAEGNGRIVGRYKLRRKSLLCVVTFASIPLLALCLFGKRLVRCYLLFYDIPAYVCIRVSQSSRELLPKVCSVREDPSPFSFPSFSPIFFFILSFRQTIQMILLSCTHIK